MRHPVHERSDTDVKQDVDQMISERFEFANPVIEYNGYPGERAIEKMSQEGGDASDVADLLVLCDGVEIIVLKRVEQRVGICSGGGGDDQNDQKRAPDVAIPFHAKRRVQSQTVAPALGAGATLR